jgi:hypothetical protein
MVAPDEASRASQVADAGVRKFRPKVDHLFLIKAMVALWLLLLVFATYIFVLSGGIRLPTLFLLTTLSAFIYFNAFLNEMVVAESEIRLRPVWFKWARWRRISYGDIGDIVILKEGVYGQFAAVRCLGLPFFYTTMFIVPLRKKEAGMRRFRRAFYLSRVEGQQELLSLIKERAEAAQGRPLEVW